MSDKYPDNWYHGHKHVLDALRFVKSENVDVGVRTVREALFEIEIDITFGPSIAVKDIAAVQGQLQKNGFNECEDAHPDDPLTHRFEWTWDGY